MRVRSAVVVGASRRLDHRTAFARARWMPVHLIGTTSELDFCGPTAVSVGRFHDRPGRGWPASPFAHRQRQKRTSGTLGPRWAVGAEPDQFHKAGHHDWMHAARRYQTAHPSTPTTRMVTGNCSGCYAAICGTVLGSPAQPKSPPCGLFVHLLEVPGP